MDKPLNILLLEDNSADVELLQRELKKSYIPHSLRVVDNKEDFEKELKRAMPDIILADHSLPNFNSIEALSIVKEYKLDIPFILITGSVSEEFAAECMKSGADDYILKSSLIRLPSTIHNFISKSNLKREKATIEELHQKLQIAHKSITDSVNYAKRIQDAMLPSKEAFLKIFPQSAVIFSPKDTLSGDFYWLSENENKIIIAVADCTGHGIPGALMSMIGNNLLNEIVNVNGITSPKDILLKLNRGVCRILNQNHQETTTQDGMDIALCLVDNKDKKIEFAGANRPLYFLKNGVINVIKGDQLGIGGIQPELFREYTSHEILFEPGDAIYLTTDGYSDQFGERKNKKMLKKNFLKLLNSFKGLSMEEQEKRLNEWKGIWQGSLEQTDDILIVGIKF